MNADILTARRSARYGLAAESRPARHCAQIDENQIHLTPFAMR